MRECRLTTTDNPYDPFEQFDSWFLFDEEKGYGTTALVGRLAKTSESLSDEENSLEIERAIDGILEYNYTGIPYKKVYREMAA